MKEILAGRIRDRKARIVVIGQDIRNALAGFPPGKVEKL